MSPVPVNVHGPYEDLGIAGINLLIELIKGMTPEQKAQVWQNWINFWQPIIDLNKTIKL